MNTSPPSWQEKLIHDLPRLGHRNWIAIVDSAYPWQNASGIDLIETGAEQLEVVRAVLHAIDAARHVRPLIYLDAELSHLPEEDAPGIGAYREALGRLVEKHQPQAQPHDQIIAQLGEAGEAFRILIFKTNLTLPYTSVFLQLDCGYWSAAAENRLRARVRATSS